jgi:Fe-S cluster biogenesis protein NfuA
MVRSAVRRVASGVRRRVGGLVRRFSEGGPAEPVPVVTSAAPEPVPEPIAQPVVAPPEPEGPPPLTREQIEAVFEEMVRPALQSDGGDITLVDVKDNDVYVELVGACQTCPSSIVTMQMGIERLLQEEFPQFRQLIRVGA